MNSVIAVRRGGLGDLLVAGPALRLLRAAFPEARLTLVSRRAYGSLFNATGIVDAVEDADDFRWAALVSPEAFQPGDTSPLLEAGIAVGWFHSRSGADFAKNAAVLWPEASIRAITVDPSAGVPLNRAFFDQTAAFLAELSRPIVPFEDCARLPDLWLRGPDFGTEHMPAGPYAVVHPGGGGRLKLWPGDRFREVICRLAAAGLSGVVVFGEAEDPLKAEWNTFILPSGWVFWNQPSLRNLAALLAGASFYLGNDSGVTHLAAVCGAPGLAVFRSEHIPAWNPGGRIDIVSSSDIRDVPVDTVLSRLNIFGKDRKKIQE